jgi:hypothetical protein
VFHSAGGSVVPTKYLYVVSPIDICENTCVIIKQYATHRHIFKLRVFIKEDYFGYYLFKTQK